MRRSAPLNTAALVVPTPTPTPLLTATAAPLFCAGTTAVHAALAPTLSAAAFAALYYKPAHDGWRIVCTKTTAIGAHYCRGLWREDSIGKKRSKKRREVHK